MALHSTPVLKSRSSLIQRSKPNGFSLTLLGGAIALSLVSNDIAIAETPLNLAPSRFAKEQSQSSKPARTVRKKVNASAPRKKTKSVKWEIVALPKRRPAPIAGNLKTEELILGAAQSDPIVTTQTAMEIHDAISAKLKDAALPQVNENIPAPKIMNITRVIEGVPAPMLPKLPDASQTAMMSEEVVADIKPIVMAQSFEVTMPKVVRTVLADPIQSVADREVLGSLFADDRLQGGVFETPVRIKPALKKALRNAQLTTASIPNSAANRSIPDLIESVIFGPQLTTASITTGSIGQTSNVQIQRFAQNTADTLGEVDIQLLLNDGGALVQQDAIWRVFSDTANALGEPVLLHRVEAPALDLSLPYGTYIIHVSYGLATTHKTVIIARDNYVDNFVLNAGGLKVSINHAVNDGFRPNNATYSIYPIADLTSLVENQEPAPIATDLPNGGIIRLNTGTYRIVSRYGDANSVIEAEARVEAGKLVEADVTHRSGDVTLKLTTQPGGSALANTQWTILGASGDLISEGVGALSKHTLAVGDYTVIAANGGQTFNREFQVVLGQNPIVEVLAE